MLWRILRKRNTFLPDVLDEMVQAFLSLRVEMVPADDPEDSGGGLQDGVWVTGWC